MPFVRSTLFFFAIVFGVVTVLISLAMVFQALGFSSLLPAAKVLNPLHALITGCGTLVTVLLAWLASKKVSDDPKETTLERNRTKVLKKVEKQWLEGVLDKSFQGSVVLELGMKSDPGAVQEHWGDLKLRELLDRPLPISTKLLHVLDEAGGALLLLGEPGSGKTTTLLQLARGLVYRARQPGQRQIPLYLNLASWAEKRQKLSEWLVDQMRLQYRIPTERGTAWVEDEEVLLLLDGLNELPQEHRAPCVKAINQFRWEHDAVDIVVCSRAGDYEALDTCLDLNAALVLQPLAPEQVDDYLSRTNSDVAEIQKATEEDEELRELLQTPLMLNFMRLVRVEAVATHESLDLRRKRIFDQYVRQTLSGDLKVEHQLPDRGGVPEVSRRRVLNWPGRRGASQRYTPDQTERWLSWLARAMYEHNQNPFFLEEMQPDWLSPRWKRILRNAFRVVGGLGGATILIVPLVLAIVGLQDRPQGVPLLSWGMVLLCVFCVFWLYITLRVALGLFNYFGKRVTEGIKIQDAMNWSWPKARYRFLRTLITTLLLIPAYYLFHVVGAVWQGTGMGSSLITGAKVVVLLPLLYGFLGGFSRGEVEERSSPNQGIRRQARNAIVAGVIGILFSVVMTLVLLIGAPQSSSFMARATIGALSLALPVGVGLALYFGAFYCVLHYVLRLTLWRGDKCMPWNYPAFLDYAAERVLLHRTGGGYIFVHALLQDYFAELEEKRSAQSLLAPHATSQPSLQEAEGISPTDRGQHVARTFALSYERLHTTDPVDVLALALLVRAAWFAPGEPIPRELLQSTLDLPDDEPNAMVRAEDAIGKLTELGLLETEEAGAVRMHQLVAALVRSEVTDEKGQRAVEEALLETVSTLLNDTGNLASLPALLPHLRTVIEAAKEREDDLSARLCDQMGQCLSLTGANTEARPYMETALAIREKIFGKEHPLTAESLYELAYLLGAQGYHEEAWPLYQEVLAIREKALGPEHPDTAATLDNLAFLLYQQSDYEEARRLWEKALIIWEKDLGAENSYTARNIHNLGCVASKQGNYEEARLHFERALAIREKVLGEEHPDTAVTLNNLANLLSGQSTNEAARPLYERVLEINKKVHGDEHPITARSLTNLAAVHYYEGSYEKARSLYERALAIYENVYGKKHPNTAQCLHSLANVLYKQRNYGSARYYQERALAIREKALGPEHPDIAYILNDLANVLLRQGEYDRARRLYERAVSIFEQAYGSEHRSTKLVRQNLVRLDTQQKEPPFRKLLRRVEDALQDFRPPP